MVVVVLMVTWLPLVAGRGRGWAKRCTLQQSLSACCSQPTCKVAGPFCLEGQSSLLAITTTSYYVGSIRMGSPSHLCNGGTSFPQGCKLQLGPGWHPLQPGTSQLVSFVMVSKGPPHENKQLMSWGTPWLNSRKVIGSAGNRCPPKQLRQAWLLSEGMYTAQQHSHPQHNAQPTLHQTPQKRIRLWWI